jgi:2,4-dienoyl-CoA reductase (NADPH2)
LSEAIAFAKLLEKENIAYLSATAGTYNSSFSEAVRKKMVPPAYLRDDMFRLTHEVKVPTIISGRIILPSLADELIKGGVCDLIGLGRPLRVDIKWVEKASIAGRNIKICKDCSWCMKRVILDKGFSCRHWPQMDQLRTDFEHELLGRSYKGLLVITDRRDLDLFRASLPLHLPDKNRVSIPVAPTIFYLRSGSRRGLPDPDRDKFLKWTRSELNRLGFDDSAIHHVDVAAREGLDKEVQKKIQQENYGVVFIGHNADQRWRERVLYKERRKVICLIGSNERQYDILVPVDLSQSTLLVLMFLRQAYMGKSGFRLNFVNILDGPMKIARLRWKKHMQIMGFEDELTLQLIPPKGDVVNDLLAVIRQGNYGTIIMGKRGLSGIKRWWLGSVSAGVLHGITDQSLFLVD